MSSGTRSQSESTPRQTLASVGEFGLIDLLTRGLEGAPAVSVGPGDDAAVFLVNGSAVVSTDVLVEGVHFRRDWSSAHDVGRKAVAVNIADMEAMGATPVALVVAFSAPATLDVQWAREFMTGLRDEAAIAGVALVGGDITASRDITIAITVIGETQGQRPVLRSGAEPGDLVAIKGRLGWAAAGLAVLARGFRSPRVVVEAQRVPQPPYGAGREAARAGATAMIDVSDGLLGDLDKVAAASGVRIQLNADDIPVDEPLKAVAAATGKNPLVFALTGGEDHALAATFPVGRVPADWVIIGTVHALADDEQPSVQVPGVQFEGSAGFDHFLR